VLLELKQTNADISMWTLYYFSEQFWRQHWIQKHPLCVSNKARSSSFARTQREGEQRTDSGSSRKQRLWQKHIHPALGEILWPRGRTSGKNRFVWLSI